jgi:hypothetical protein
MTKLIVMLWTLLRRRLAELRVLLTLGITIAGVVGWLAPPPGQWRFPAVVRRLVPLSGEWPWPAAEQKVEAHPQEIMEVKEHVTHIWLSEPLVNLAKRERWSVEPERHQQTRKILAGEGGHGFFFAFTLQLRHAKGIFGYIDYIRYPIREPDNVRELVEVMATAAGNPPQNRTTDFSNAVIHVVPAVTSRQELLDEIESASLWRDSGLPSR